MGEDEEKPKLIDTLNETAEHQVHQDFGVVLGMVVLFCIVVACCWKYL